MDAIGGNGFLNIGINVESDMSVMISMLFMGDW